MTDENLSATTAGGNGYYFAPVNLGWCDGKMDLYAARSLKVRVWQNSKPTAENEAEPGVTVQQTEKTITSLGNSPFYQFGRKDPMPASVGDANSSKTYYPSGGTYIPQVSVGESIGAAIRTPYVFYILSSSPQRWTLSPYFKLWNAALNGYGQSQNGTAVTKTVYDPLPCPLSQLSSTTSFGPTPAVHPLQEGITTVSFSLQQALSTTPAGNSRM